MSFEENAVVARGREIGRLSTEYNALIRACNIVGTEDMWFATRAEFKRIQAEGEKYGYHVDANPTLKWKAFDPEHRPLHLLVSEFVEDFDNGVGMGPDIPQWAEKFRKAIGEPR